MGHRARRIAALAVTGLLVAAAAAVAHDDDDGNGRPQADDVQATVTFTHLKGKFRECEGQDGTYSENHFTFSGTSAGDPRLTGLIEVSLAELVNLTEGNGPQQGTVLIRDAATGRRKAKGEFASWGPLDFTQGAIVGRVQDEGAGPEPTRGDGRLIANWRITYTETGVSAQIGGAATDNRLPAGIWSGKCRGKFEEVDVDLGAAGVGATSAGRTWRQPAR